jgi:Hyaluronidase
MRLPTIVIPRLAAAIAVIAAPLAMGQTSPPGGTPAQFKIFNDVRTDSWDLANGARQDWAAMINFGGVPMDRNVITIYSHLLGNYPVMGPQGIVGAPGGGIQDHVNKIRRDLDRVIPDVNFSGVALIDYESWNLVWDVADATGKANWTSYQQTLVPSPIDGLSGDAREDMLRRTYEQAAKDIYLATINACKQARPKAKWAFLCYPDAYGGSAAGYDDPTQSAKLRARSDQLQWLWDAEDVIVPSITSCRQTVPAGASRDPLFQYTIQEHRDFIRAMVHESERVSNGKPVYAFFWIRIVGVAGQGATSGQLISPTGVEVLFEEISHSSLDGMILWDDLASRTQYDAFQNFMTIQLAPKMRPLVMSALGDAPPPTVGGGILASPSFRRSASLSPPTSSLILRRQRVRIAVARGQGIITHYVVEGNPQR